MKAKRTPDSKHLIAHLRALLAHNLKRYSPCQISDAHDSHIRLCANADNLPLQLTSIGHLDFHLSSPCYNMRICNQIPVIIVQKAGALGAGIRLDHHDKLLGFKNNILQRLRLARFNRSKQRLTIKPAGNLYVNRICRTHSSC
ncbi:hypothetical protein D3C78_1438750 [compost metagenome]